MFLEISPGAFRSGILAASFAIVASVWSAPGQLLSHPVRQIDSTLVTRLLNEAELEFARTPRTHGAVVKSLELIQEAMQISDKSDKRRYQLLTRGAWFAIWLSYTGSEKKEIVRFASQAMKLAETAIRLDRQRVEGYYHRAIATGLFAEQHQAQSREAMFQIRDDALRAIKIDPAFDHGGPHRLLGALYLRAPGPPAGIGSTRRAVQHLEAAIEIAPRCPENILFLTEAYLKAGQQEKARLLLKLLDPTEVPCGDLMSKQALQDQVRILKGQLEQE